MLQLAPHYKSTIRFLLRFACIMFCVGLVMGFVIRELGRFYIQFNRMDLNNYLLIRMVSYEKLENTVGNPNDVGGIHAEGTLLLNLIHGHVFLMGEYLSFQFDLIAFSNRFNSSNCDGLSVDFFSPNWRKRNSRTIFAIFNLHVHDWLHSELDITILQGLSTFQLLQF